MRLGHGAMLTGPLLTICQNFSASMGDYGTVNLRVLRVHDTNVGELILQLSE